METASKTKVLTITRLIDAPVALVFKAWSDPVFVSKWWGPGGFTAPTIEIDFRVGGKFLFCMRSNDGQEFWTTGKYTEIVPLKKICYTDSFADPKGNIVPASYYQMSGDWDEALNVTVIFEAVGNRTRMTLQHSGIPAGTMTELTEAGWTESFVKFENSVEPTAPGDRKELVITRTFNAPRSLVFQAFTESERLAHWWGPKGMKLTVEKIDLRQGGVFHYRMDSPDGNKMYGRFVYREISPVERLIFVVSFSDEKCGITRHPLSKTWPLETLNIITFEEKDGKTNLTLRSWPIRESEVERQSFEEGFASMNAGFGGTMDQLDNYLASLHS
jgi:uncharacterized protein YndB with AHSA1/START domain